LNRSSGASGKKVGSIPDGPLAVTPDWLTEVLRCAGILGSCSIVSVEVETPASPPGLLSRLSRLRISCDRQVLGVPETLIAKFHPSDPELRKSVCEANVTEAKFYAEVVPHSNLSTPKVYYSDLDSDSCEFVLLLEDLSEQRIVDDLKGCGPEDAEAVVRNLAAFHAGWWSDSRLESMDWLKPFDRSLSFEVLGIPVSQFEGSLPDGIGEVARRIKGQYATLFEAQSKRPRTVVLNDVKARHMFFAIKNGVEIVSMVDFQLAVQGRGALDVSRFFGSSLTTCVRRAHEHDLLCVYHDVLTSMGVTGYSFDALCTDYRFGHLQNLVDYMAVEAQGLQARGGARLQEIQEEQLRRYTAAIEDLDCAELLPG